MNAGKKILLVEDSAVIAKLLSLKIAYDGVSVVHFPTLEGVYEGVIYHKPDLVLLDIMMHLKDGLINLKRIKSDPGLSNIPVIIMSTNPHNPSIEEGLRLGAVAYINKPFVMSELVSEIYKYL